MQRRRAFIVNGLVASARPRLPAMAGLDPRRIRFLAAELLVRSGSLLPLNPLPARPANPKRFAVLIGDIGDRDAVGTGLTLCLRLLEVRLGKGRIAIRLRPRAILPEFPYLLHFHRRLEVGGHLRGHYSARAICRAVLKHGQRVLVEEHLRRHDRLRVRVGRVDRGLEIKAML